MRMIKAVAKTIITFQLVKDSCQAPVILGAKPLNREGITGTLLPGERRISFFRPSGWNLNGSGRKWISIVQMFRKILTCLHIMNHGNKTPRNTLNLTHSLIAFLIRDEAVNKPFNCRNTLRQKET